MYCGRGAGVSLQLCFSTTDVLDSWRARGDRAELVQLWRVKEALLSNLGQLTGDYKRLSLSTQVSALVS